MLQTKWDRGWHWGKKWKCSTSEVHFLHSQKILKMLPQTDTTLGDHVYDSSPSILIFSVVKRPQSRLTMSLVVMYWMLCLAPVISPFSSLVPTWSLPWSKQYWLILRLGWLKPLPKSSVFAFCPFPFDGISIITLLRTSETSPACFLEMPLITRFGYCITKERNTPTETWSCRGMFTTFSLNLPKLETLSCNLHSMALMPCGYALLRIHITLFTTFCDWSTLRHLVFIDTFSSLLFALYFARALAFDFSQCRWFFT